MTFFTHFGRYLLMLKGMFTKPGNMRMSEQIDALEIMGINTKSYLIMPKIAACLVTIPLLVVLSMVLGIWGGRVAGAATGILSTDTYDAGLLLNFLPYNVFFAL